VYEDCAASACDTDLPYSPIVVVPGSFLAQLDPTWAACSAELKGLYDPPKPLTPVSAIAGPSITPAGATVSVPATPGSNIG